MDAQEKKLRQSIWIIIGVGIFLTIALAVGLVTQVINKQRVAIAAAKADYETQKAQADQLPDALKAKQKAEDNKEYVTGQLAFFRQRFRSLPFGALDASQVTSTRLTDAEKANMAISNKNVAWRRWMNEYANGYGPALKREIEAAANETGVVVKSSVKVGDPPKAPEECVPPTNSLLRPTGGPLAISINGSLSNILQFLNRINQSSILLLVNNDIKMSGYSPDLTATFTVTPYLIATGEGAPVTAASSAVAPAAEGGGSSAMMMEGSSSSSSSSSRPGGSSNAASP